MWKTLSSQPVENPFTTHYWFVTFSHVYAHPKLSMLFGDMVFSPLLQGRRSHSFIALKVASSHIWQTQSETWSTQRRHLPLWRRSNASLISESLRLWVMYSSTLISCILKMHTNICQKPHWKTLIFTEDIGWVVIALICSSVIKDLSRSLTAYFYV